MRNSWFGTMKQCTENSNPIQHPETTLTIAEEESFRTNGIISEYAVFCIVSLISLNAGYVSQMTASMLDYWQFTNNTITDPNQLVLLDLEPTGSSIIASLIFFFVASFWGLKPCLYLAALSGVISGLLFAYNDNNIVCIISAKAMTSMLVTGAYMICPIYIMEMVHDSTRGFFTAGSSFMIYGGMIIAYSLEAVVSQPMVCSFLWIILVSFLFLFFWLPESPYFLASKGKLQKAEGAVIWMRRLESELVKPEVEEIVEMVEADTGPCCTLKNDSGVGIATAISLYILRTTGGICLIHPLYHMFRFSLPINSEEVHGIILSLSVVSSFLGSIAVDRAGRKMMLYVSYGGSCLSFLLITICTCINSESLGIVPLVCLCIFAILYGLGYGTVTPLLALELTPVRSRYRMMAMAVFLESILSICIVISHQPIVIILESYVNYIIPTVGNGIGVLFVWMVVPETSHKTIKDIQKIQIT